MRILHLIASVDPVGGGPLEYARIVAAEHARAGHESVFITLDDPECAAALDFAFELHATGPVGGLLRSTPRYGATVAQIAPGCDGVVVHGLWNHASIGGYRALRKAGLPWVVFVHGMLSPYFRRTRPGKHLIKQMYWWLWQGRVLKRARGVLYTCAEERRLAQDMFLGFGGYPEREMAFCSADLRGHLGSSASAQSGAHAMGLQLGHLGYFLFLGRIDPIKSIDTLIVAYARLAARPDCPDLVIAGPDTVGWKSALQSLAAAQGVGERVHFPGMLRGAAKAAAFAGAEAFVLPSHQENFGLVVAEALSVGTPVLLSDKVNIWREVVEAGAGLAEPDTIEGTERLLRRFLDLPAESRNALRSAARPCYEKHFSAKAAADDLLDVLIHARKASP